MRDHILPASIVLSALIVAGAWAYTENFKARLPAAPKTGASGEEAAAPSTGQTVELPVRWGDLGKRLVETGVIDQAAFEAVYADRGGLNEEDRVLLAGVADGNLRVNERNAGVLLTLLWALGLGNKNTILETGPMMSPRYGGDASRFASTGGWTLARGNPMDHYSKHPFVTLTKERQDLVERVSKNVYRPCCNNPTHFPDCNHGMAMLGLLDLLASQGVAEGEMYRAALQMNAFWFPDQYATLTSFFSSRGIDPRTVDPEQVVSEEYSSAQGYRAIAAQVTAPTGRKGGSCGV